MLRVEHFVQPYFNDVSEPKCGFTRMWFPTIDVCSIEFYHSGPMPYQKSRSESITTKSQFYEHS